MNAVTTIRTLIFALILLACDSTLSRWDNVHVNVHEFDPNPPWINVGEDIVTNEEFQRRATTELLERLTYSWTKMSGPGSIIFGTPTEQETSIAADQDGLYVIRATAKNELGDEAFDEFQLTWDTTPPEAPSILRTLAGSLAGSDVRITNQTTIVLSWDEAKDAGVGVKEYTVTWYAGDNCSGFENTLAGLLTPHHTITGQDGDTFSFKVTATDQLDQSQTSSCSPSIRIDTSLPPALTAFTGATGSAVASTKLTLTLPADFTDYDSITIRRTTGAAAPVDCSSGDLIKTYAKADLNASLVYADLAPAAGAAYSYRVCIADAAGNELGQNTATNIATKDHYIFVSSQTTDGTFGGSGGTATADAFCMGLAVASTQSIINEELKWRAIVSTSTTNAASRIQVLGKIRTTDVPTFTLAANDANELWSGTLLTYVGNDETGGAVGAEMVWTGTLSDGTTAPQTCNNWTSNSIGLSAIVGDPGAINNTWIGNAATETCNTPLRVYCISQR